MHLFTGTHLGNLFGILALSFLILGAADKRMRITRALGSVFVFFALSNFYVELRSAIPGTRYWETSTILLVAFGATYTYFFTSLANCLGIPRAASAIRGSLLPFVYLGLIGTILACYEAEGLENPALALFLFVVFVSAIHVVIYLAVVPKLYRSTGPPKIMSLANSMRRDLNLSIAGTALITIGLGLGQVLYPGRMDLFVLDVLILCILAVPLIAVRRVTCPLTPRTESYDTKIS